ncbi:MAG: hypothetical protein VKL39_10300 [Leptolyngbyaceae bacterium]|nr:hypothetical protein [Leptolyngbyaceae bacterium]
MNKERLPRADPIHPFYAELSLSVAGLESRFLRFTRKENALTLLAVAMQSRTKKAMATLKNLSTNEVEKPNLENQSSKPKVTQLYIGLVTPAKSWYG